MGCSSRSRAGPRKRFQSSFPGWGALLSSCDTFQFHIGFTMVKPMWDWNVSHELNNAPQPGKLDWKRFLGPARDRELQPMRFRNWRYFWDYSGGNMTDQGTHLMDVVQWYTDSGTPRSAVCYGQVAKMTGSAV